MGAPGLKGDGYPGVAVSVDIVVLSFVPSLLLFFSFLTLHMTRTLIVSLIMSSQGPRGLPGPPGPMGLRGVGDTGAKVRF